MLICFSLDIDYFSYIDAVSPSRRQFYFCFLQRFLHNITQLRQSKNIISQAAGLIITQQLLKSAEQRSLRCQAVLQAA